MRNEWDKLYEALAEFQIEMEELLPELPQSKNFNIKATAIKRKWALAQKLANDLHEMITPAQPVPVNSPFDHAEFLTAWQMWKEYLAEQHNIQMRSRMEVCGLKRLAELSATDHKKAIRILELAMATGYKNFFRIDDKQAESDKSTEAIKY